MRAERPTTSTRRRPGRARLALAGRVCVLLGVLAAALALTAHSLGPPGEPASAAPGAATSPSAVAEDEGQRVFLRDCAWCHGDEGGGTRYGPSLEESGEAAADFYLRTGRMPLKAPDDRPEAGPPAYSDATIDALVAYVGTLGTGKPIPPVGEGDVAAGRRLFLSNCAACHSSSGTGMILSDGAWAPELFDTPSQQVAEAVRLGPGPMPEFKDTELSDEEVDDIVSYVDDLGDEQVTGGEGLDQFGPIAEGLFVWLVIIPVVLVVLRVLGKKAQR